MSRRPAGPCDRVPCYFGQEELQAQQRDAPRLPGQSIGSKVMVGSLLLCCCGIIAICVLCIASLAVALPPPHRVGDVPQQQAVGAAVVSIDQRGVYDGRQRHHAQRSVIRRLAMLKRSAQGRGVDLDSVRLMFPAWLDAGGALVADQAVGDMVLALSYLSQEDDAEDGNTVGVG
jgi:hypothetical protein